MTNKVIQAVIVLLIGTILIKINCSTVNGDPLEPSKGPLVAP